jgi:hypothetical protein
MALEEHSRSAMDLHTESALVRAWREFGHCLMNSVPIWLWVIGWTLAGSGLAAYLSAGGSAKAQAITVVVVGALFLCAGIATAFPFIWASRVRVQRDEARQELEAFYAPRQFPDLSIDANWVHQEGLEVDGHHGMLIWIPLVITNSQTDRAASLEFRLGIFDVKGNEIAAAFPRELDKLPLRVNPTDTEKLRLDFELQPSVVDRVLDRELYRSIPNPLLRLYVNERVSGKYLALRLPSYYPPVPERGR